MNDSNVLKTNVPIKPLLKKKDSKVIILWVDDNGTKSKSCIHKELYNTIKKNSYIEIYEADSTAQAIEWFSNLNTKMIKNNVIRVITDMHRFEIINGKKEERKQAGMELIKELKKMDYYNLYGIEYIKIYSGSVHEDEAKCFLLGYPVYFFYNTDLFEFWIT
jgi:hypothetical protein